MEAGEDRLLRFKDSKKREMIPPDVLGFRPSKNKDGSHDDGSHLFTPCASTAQATHHR
jgi:hypothetical protein